MKRTIVLVLGLLVFFFGAKGVLLAQDEDLLPDNFLVEEEVTQCKPESLITVYDKAVADSVSDLEIRQQYNFGSEHFKNKNYKSALPYLWTVFLKDTGQFGDDGKRAKLAIGKITQIYYDEQKVDSTLLASYRGLERFPDQIRLHYYAGFLQDNLGRYICAIPHYEELVASDSASLAELQTAGGPADKLEATKTSYIQNLRKLAFFYFKDGNEEAIEMQRRIVDLDPTDPDASNTLALYTEHFYGAGAGLEHFEQAYQNNPDDLALALRFGKAAVRNGEYSKAIEPLTKCIQADMGKEPLVLRAEAYENLNQTTNAINDYKSLLDLDPDNADVMLNISLAYSTMNNFQNASYWINRALQVKPGYGLAYIVRGELFEMAVSYCQNQRGKEAYEDKLVYERAFEEYAKAKRDAAFISRANTKQNNLRPFLPTTEDKFMHKGDKIESACYDFMK